MVNIACPFIVRFNNPVSPIVTFTGTSLCPIHDVLSEYPKRPFSPMIEDNSVLTLELYNIFIPGNAEVLSQQVQSSKQIASFVPVPFSAGGSVAEALASSAKL